MGELIISPATEHDRATFLASVDGLFHEDAGVHDRYGDPEWAARGGAAYFADLLTNPEAIPLLARDGERALGHLVGRVLEPDTLRPGTRVAGPSATSTAGSSDRYREGIERRLAAARASDRIRGLVDLGELGSGCGSGSSGEFGDTAEIRLTGGVWTPSS